MAIGVQWRREVWNPITAKLEAYMDLAAARQKLVAANIANASTPGFKAKDLDFAGELRRSMEQPAGIEKASPEIVEVDGLVAGNDGNNVSLDRESRLLMENALRFNAASQLWRSELRQVKMAIQSGKAGA